MSENSETIGVFWRRDTGLVLKRTRGRYVRILKNNGVFWQRDIGLVLKRKRVRSVRKFRENWSVFGDKTLVLC